MCMTRICNQCDFLAEIESQIQVSHTMQMPVLNTFLNKYTKNNGINLFPTKWGKEVVKPIGISGPGTPQPRKIS